MEDKKIPKTVVKSKSVSIENGDNIKVSNRLTEKEKVVRRMKKYANLGNFNERIASLSTAYSDVTNSSYGNFYSPQLSTDFLEKPQNLRERRAWYRHFYNSNEFVGQAIDLHSTLPLSKIRLEKPEGKNQEQVDYVYNFFVEMCNELKLFKVLLEISHEFNLFGNCVPGYAKLETINEIKDASEIEEGDLVLTDQGRFRKVLKICRRKADDFVSIKCKGSYLLLEVTPEHPIQVIRNNNICFVEAKDVKTEDYVLVSYPSEEEDVTDIFVDDISLAMDENLAYLIGFWMGNGTLANCYDFSDKDEYSFIWEISIAQNEEELIEKIRKLMSLVFWGKNLEFWYSNDFYYIKLKSNRSFFEWWSSEFGNCGDSKKIPEWFLRLPKNKLLKFLEGIIDSDNTEVNKEGITIAFYDEALIKGVRNIALKCGLICDFDYVEGKYKVKYGSIKTHYFVLKFCEKEFCEILTKNTIKKILPDSVFVNNKFWIKEKDKIALKIEKISSYKNPDTLVYNFEIEEDHTYSVNGFNTHNCFIYAEDDNPYEEENEEKVKELKEKGKIEAERLYKEFGIIDRDPNYKGWRKLIILPPDQVRIRKIPLSDDCIIEYIPDPETRKNILSAQQGGLGSLSIEEEKVISKIPKDLVQALQNSGSIPLDTDPYSGSYVYHLARKKSQYETLGVSILERCINTLLLQDKLRQAQTQIASRHMTPIRIVWGESLSDFDVEALREQVDLALVDPDYSIVTNYEVHWEEMGSNGRLLELSSEYDHIENSLFAGLGVTRELLTGEGTYAGNRVTLEILNTQYLLFRALLQEYVEDYLFKPVAKKKGFVEKDKYGRERLLYPKLSFTRLAIKDNDSFFDQAMQLYNKGSISIDVILDTLNIDPVVTKKKIEADLFTTNDFAFNQLMSNIYTAVAQVLVERYDIAGKLAEYLKLEELSQPAAPEGGGTGGGIGLGLGRFASSLSKEKQEQLNKLIFLALKNSDKLNKLLDYFNGNNGNNGNGNTEITKEE